MRMDRIAFALVMAAAVAFTAATAHADWYDGGLLGIQDRAVNWVAELWVCGWGGC